MINARVETLQAKFGNLLERRRCLVASDGFYEWRTDPDGRRRASATRWRTAACSPSPGCGRLAGPADRRAHRSCTILTTQANALVAAGARPDAGDPPRGGRGRAGSPRGAARPALALLVPLAPERMAVAEASLLVNSPDNDGPELLDPLAGSPEGVQLPLL